MTQENNELKLLSDEALADKVRDRLACSLPYVWELWERGYGVTVQTKNEKMAEPNGPQPGIDPTRPCLTAMDYVFRKHEVTEL